MSNSVYRRCGCRDENGRQYGAACPQLADPKHGSLGLLPVSMAPTRGPAGGASSARVDTAPNGRLNRRSRSCGPPSTRAATSRRARSRSRSTPQPGCRAASRREPGSRRRRWTATAATCTRTSRRPILGQMKLTDIRRYHVAAFLDELSRAGRGAVTVRRIATRLQTILQSAVRDELIQTNPAQGADRPTVEREEVHLWEPEHVRTFLARCAAHRLGAVFEVAVFTGLCRGELTGLRWSDVDLVVRKIIVRRNRVQSRSGAGAVHQDARRPAHRAAIGLRGFDSVGVAAPPGPGARRGRGGLAERGACVHHGDGRPLDPAYVTRLFQVLERAGESRCRR